MAKCNQLTPLPFKGLNAMCSCQLWLSIWLSGDDLPHLSVFCFVQGMSFAKGLSANFISTPLSSSAAVVGAVLSGSESTLHSAGQTSGFSSIAASASETSRSLPPGSVYIRPLSFW